MTKREMLVNVYRELRAEMFATDAFTEDSAVDIVGTVGFDMLLDKKYLMRVGETVDGTPLYNFAEAIR